MGIMLDRKQLKREARASMRAAAPRTGWVTLVFVTILLILEMLSLKLEFPATSLKEIFFSYVDLDEDALNRLLLAAGRQNFISRLLGYAISIMTMVLSVGYAGYALNVARNVPAGFGDLFDAFSILLKVLWLQILESIFIALWSMLFIIPGIVAAYRYSMAVFILLDDPDKGAMQCIRESKEMTRGYKGKLFWLDMSFIGWWILCAIPFVGLYVLPYTTVARANYYKVLSGRYDAPWVESGTGPDVF